MCATWSERSPRLVTELERIGREREEASRQIERTERLELARCCVEMIGAVLAGFFLYAFALRVDDVATGETLLLAGMFVQVLGVVLSLFGAWRRAEARGDT